MRKLLVLLFVLPILAYAQAVQYAGYGDGITDNTPAFNAAVTSVCASTGNRELRIGSGKFLFMSAPTAIPCALKLTGDQPSTTVLIKRYQSTLYFIKWGGTSATEAGGAMSNMTLDAGTSTGAICLWAQVTQATVGVPLVGPHGLDLNRVFCVAGYDYPNQGSWAYGFLLDGSLNINPPVGAAIGIRGVRMEYVGASQFTTLPFLLDHAYGTRIMGADCYVPIGGATQAIWTVADLPPPTWVLSATCPVSAH